VEGKYALFGGLIDALAPPLAVPPVPVRRPELGLRRVRAWAQGVLSDRAR